MAVLLNFICIGEFKSFSNGIMSFPMKWGDIQCIVFSPVVCLSVCLSVGPSRFRIRSISFEPLVGFTNNLPEMLAIMRQCAVPMFYQGRFKVKVKESV